MSAVKTDQSEGIPGAGIPGQAVKKMLTGSAALSLPSPFAFFRAFFLNSRFPHYLGAWNRLVTADNKDQSINQTGMLKLQIHKYSLTETANIKLKEELIVCTKASRKRNNIRY